MDKDSLADVVDKNQIAKVNECVGETKDVGAAKMEYCPLYEERFAKLYNKLKSTVWIIRVIGVLGDEILVSHLTGFCVDEHGLIMTCAHGWSKMSSLIIKARRLDEDDFHEAKLIKFDTRWDLGLIRIEELTRCGFQNMAADGSLNEGQTILHIGHPREFVASFLIGRVAYRCLENVTFSSNQSLTCEYYDLQPLNSTPPYRIMGHLWHTRMFEDQRDEMFSYEKNLDPLLPIIQCNGLTCGEGCSGGPVFNTRGNIVGMLVAGASRYQIAIHVTALREFLEIAKREIKNPPQVSVDFGRKDVPKKGEDASKKRKKRTAC